MKKYSKLLAVGSCFLALICVSCGNEPVRDGTEAPAVQTTGPAPAPEDFYLVRGGKAELSLITPASGADNIIRSAASFKKDLDSWTAAVFTEETYPAETVTADTPGILIGNCAADESASFIGSLGSDEYGFAVIGNKIVIAGKTDNLTVVALKKFKDTVITGKDYRKDGDIVIPSDFRMTFTQTGTSASALCPWAITQDDFRIEGAVKIKPVCMIPSSGQYTVSQGAATDGKSFFNAFVSSGGSGIIVRTPLSGSRSESVKSEAISLNHANDICYNSKDKKLVIVNMSGNKLTFVDPETLTVTGTPGFQGADGGAYAITYNEKKGGYAVLAGSSVYICDNDLKVTGQRSLHFEGDYTAQGVDSDDNYIYAPYSIGQNTKDTLIAVYSWTGKYIRTIHIPVNMECESMMNTGGRYFLSFYSSGATICELSFNIYY